MSIYHPIILLAVTIICLALVLLYSLNNQSI